MHRVSKNFVVENSAQLWLIRMQPDCPAFLQRNSPLSSTRIPFDRMGYFSDNRGEEAQKECYPRAHEGGWCRRVARSPREKRTLGALGATRIPCRSSLNHHSCVCIQFHLSRIHSIISPNNMQPHSLPSSPTMYYT